MTDELRISISKKIICGNEIQKELRLRNKTHVFKSINKSSSSEYDELVANGWELDKEFKTKYKLKKEKPHDVMFEDKVWSLFASLGFNYLNKNRCFEIPYEKDKLNLTQQIDVFAMDDETLLIVECKSTTEKNKRGDFKTDLEAYKTKIGGIKNTISAFFPDKKLKFKFIFATENYAVSDNDLDRLEILNGIHFDDEVINYYLNMVKQIGLAARYQLLGSLFHDVEIPEMDNRIPAITGKMGGYSYYSFSIEPEKLLKIGYVLHRNKANVNMMPTYQRIIKRSRIKSVQEFIDNKNGYFPNSIIISLDSNGKGALKFDRANTQVKSAISNVGVLHLPKRYRSAYIIDGQHRLYGYANSEFKNKNSIPVVAFLDLDRSEQVKLFMDINEHQKAVSKNLRNTLNADLLWTSKSYIDQHTALRSRIAISLGEDRKSALYDKITIGEDSKVITSQAFDNALKKTSFFGKVKKDKIEELGSFYQGNIDDSYEKLLTFLNLTFDYLKENLSDSWNIPESIVVMNKGIFAFINLLSDIVDHLLENEIIKRNDSAISIFEECKTYLDPAINFIISIDNESRNALRKAYGSNGDIKYWRTLQREVNDTYSDFAPLGLKEYFKCEAKEYNTKTFEFIREIETFLKENFKIMLKNEFGNNWLKKGVPPQTLKKAHDMAFEKNLKVDNERDEVSDWDCLTIIAYRAIALKNWRNIFEKSYTYTKTSKGGNKEEKTKWMVRLEEIRNKTVHSYYVSEEEYDFVTELKDWLIK